MQDIQTAKESNEFQEGDTYDGIIIETFRDEKLSRPRVRPIGYFHPEMKVEFPRALREENPIGSRFRATVKVCQKHNKDGSTKGEKYLSASPKSITLLEEYTPPIIIKAVRCKNSKSDRVYEYIFNTDENTDTNQAEILEKLRESAWKAAVDYREGIDKKTTSRERNVTIKTYALTRANGVCEACLTPAPFLTKNGIPYLEVHHIVELSKGGADSPDNVAAICPNCHARVTYGSDAESYNKKILAKILDTEQTHSNS